MAVKDLHSLPKVRDSWSYLYVDRCRIDQEGRGISIFDQRGRVDVPCANLMLLILGPGTTITHAAVRTLAEHGCLIEWAGEAGVRFYAAGTGETRSARNLLRQAYLASDPGSRLAVVRRMYEFRFDNQLPAHLSLQQIRGAEGRRMRDAYQAASEATGVAWHGRQYKTSDWGAADPINRALSVANSCLYGICHAAIVSAGYSPSLGFVHHGHILSFVHDIADLYKTEVTIPLAFRVVAESGGAKETQVRAMCRNRFYETRLLDRIVPDIGKVLSTAIEYPSALEVDGDDSTIGPSWLWDPETGAVSGGVNYGEEPKPQPEEAE